MKKAVILFSGGLDSTTILYLAASQGYELTCLTFDYGQRHRREIQRALVLAKDIKAAIHVLKIKLPWQGSSLLTKSMPLPRRSAIDVNKIPTTYVPARNIIFLSYGVSLAEAIQCRDVFIGANAVDYSGYPDCRPKFFSAFKKMIECGLKSSVENHRIRIHTPLLYKSKAQIVRLGKKLGVPFHKTWSCYQGSRLPCGFCDSCLLRRRGFDLAREVDP